MKRVVLTLFLVLLLLASGAAAFVYSGIHDVSASAPHGAFSRWVMETARRSSVERRAARIEVPELDDRSLVLAGVNDFESMCVQCHGAPGKEPGDAGKGLNPPAPDLAESAREMSAGELFWVTKHGLRMTGMPSWGSTHPDDALWPVVALMRVLPELDAEGYEDLLNRAGGMGHHSSDSSDDGHPHGTDEQESEAPEHDHSGHEH